MKPLKNTTDYNLSDIEQIDTSPGIGIIVQRPPNYDDILKVFPMAEMPSVVFAFNGKIYAPGGRNVPVSIQMHESVHIQRQGQGLEASIEWWDKYLKDSDFRYEEEVWAHRAEYLACLELAQNRNERRGALKHVASKLSSRLYGPMCTMKQAMKDVAEAKQIRSDIIAEENKGRLE